MSNSTLSDFIRPQHSYSSEIQGDSGGGSFVKYLPQYEAVAAGLGAEEGGLESQAVVDLLNIECSRLLDLNPKDFWTEGFSKFLISSIVAYLVVFY